MMRALRWVGRASALALVAYLFAAIVLRPWYRHWGATLDDRAEKIAGDERSEDPRRASDCVIDIAAPAEDVFPWLLQIGWGRGGFYSYTSLENLFGLHIENADRIEERWQTLAPGDFVRAVPPTWAGGAFGDRVGWDVDRIEPNRLLGLRYWQFEVEPTSERASRLHIRTHAGNPPLPIGPMIAFVFEPAHFIMQREMMLQIKARAERLADSGGGV